MHWMIFCMAIIFGFGELLAHDDPELENGDYQYTTYDVELKLPSINRHRIARKTGNKELQVTHRQVEVILTEPTTTSTTSEERKLRYNEKVYLPEVRGVENATFEPHQVFKNNISVALMSAPKRYQKEAWDRVCLPLTGSAHPDGKISPSTDVSRVLL